MQIAPAPTTPAPEIPAKQRPPSTVKPGALSLAAAREYLGGLPMQSLYDLAALGKIVFVRRGQKRTLVLVKSLDEYLETLPRVVINLSTRAAKKREAERLKTEARFEELKRKAVTEEDAAEGNDAA
jgi:hypothetical protein